MSSASVNRKTKKEDSVELCCAAVKEKKPNISMLIVALKLFANN